MGREIKRVAAGFSPPLDEVWQGFINPHTATECSACGGSGTSPEANNYTKEWYGYVPFDPASTGSRPFPDDHPHFDELAKRNCPGSEARQRVERRRLAILHNSQRSHHLTQWEVDALWEEKRLWDFKTKPAAAMVNEWSLYRFGHDCINLMICADAYCKRNNFERECKACNGTGNLWPSKEVANLHDDWEPTEPPSGDWWQLWTTTTEGSPMTPAFATAEELARFCAENGVSTFADETADYDTWLKFIVGPGWAPSAILADGVMLSGVAAVK